MHTLDYDIILLPGSLAPSVNIGCFDASYRASVKEVPRSRSRSTFSALKIKECTRYKV